MRDNDGNKTPDQATTPAASTGVASESISGSVSYAPTTEGQKDSGEGITPDPRIIPMLDLRPSNNDLARVNAIYRPHGVTQWDMGKALKYCPDTLSAVAAHRVAAARQAIEWIKMIVCDRCYRGEMMDEDVLGFHLGYTHSFDNSYICRAHPITMRLATHDVALAEREAKNG